MSDDTPFGHVVETELQRKSKHSNCHKHGNGPVCPTVGGGPSPDEPRGKQERGHDTRENGELLLTTALGSFISERGQQRQQKAPPFGGVKEAVNNQGLIPNSSRSASDNENSYPLGYGVSLPL
jgi:hypothetical protein